MNSRVQFEIINYHLAAVYLGTTMDKTRQIKEGAANLIPTRKAKSRRGRKVTVHTKELGGPKGRKVLGEDQNPIGRHMDLKGTMDDSQDELSKWHKIPQAIHTGGEEAPYLQSDPGSF